MTEPLRGRWSFTLQGDDDEVLVQADDTEHGDLNRLALWAAVRGIEAVDGTASIMIVSGNRYLIRSMTECLPRWRAGGFVWEHFGRTVEVQNADLWRRLDRSVSFHDVQACLVAPKIVSPRNALAGQRPPAGSRLTAGSRMPGGIKPGRALSAVTDQCEPIDNQKPFAAGASLANFENRIVRVDRAHRRDHAAADSPEAFRDAGSSAVPRPRRRIGRRSMRITADQLRSDDD